ncbi:hypothetical protein A3860_16965 [Niastella vici]|uniref:DUF4907 domain-containing protein n=1 Tax=Niastella vici TaxID=1703345 RepID=A0A1V9G4D7_9BACT|nr:DUF4907 domain-containing protein [Niastella vici]OQP65358.1 hypothetical protein A3860_16965 [Niastella vici]
MTINRTHKLVLLAAILIAVSSTFYLLAVKQAPSANGLHYNCFKTENGWGYDVLYNERVLIHQPMIPGKSGGSGFDSEKAAGADAKTVIEKIKSGEFPLFGQKQQQRSGVLRTQ